MLVINGLIFKLPQIIWNFAEGGVMKDFYNENAKSKLIAGQEEKMQDILRQHKIYLNKLKGQFNWYYLTFMFCQLLNVVTLTVNYIAIDNFLDGKFWNYGSEVIHYNGLGDQLKKSAPNPMCDAFPTRVSKINNISPTICKLFPPKIFLRNLPFVQRI